MQMVCVNAVAELGRKRDHRQREERKLPRKETCGCGGTRARVMEQRRLLKLLEESSARGTKWK